MDHLKPLLAIPLGNQSKLAFIEQLFLTIDHYTIPIIINGKQILGNVQKHVIEYQLAEMDVKTIENSISGLQKKLVDATKENDQGKTKQITDQLSSLSKDLENAKVVQSETKQSWEHVRSKANFYIENDVKNALLQMIELTKKMQENEAEVTKKVHDGMADGKVNVSVSDEGQMKIDFSE